MQKESVDAMEGLGVVAVPSKGRTLAKKELQRINEAIEVMKSIKTLPNSRKEQRVFCKMFDI